MPLPHTASLKLTTRAGAAATADGSSASSSASSSNVPGHDGSYTDPGPKPSPCAAMISSSPSFAAALALLSGDFHESDGSAAGAPFEAALLGGAGVTGRPTMAKGSASPPA